MIEALEERLTFLDGIEHEPRTAGLLERRLAKQNNKWGIDDSTFGDYARAVDPYLSEPGQSLLGIIQAQIGVNRGNVGIDIAGGSHAKALRELLDLGILDRALVTNYIDDPRLYEPGHKLYIEPDERLDHIDGDIIDPNTWRSIISWQTQHAPKGFDLVMHRPVLSLQDLPPRFYMGAATLLLDMLGSPGVMLAQIPLSFTGPWQRYDLAPLCSSIKQREGLTEVIKTESPGIHHAVMLKGSPAMLR